MARATCNSDAYDNFISSTADLRQHANAWLAPRLRNWHACTSCATMEANFNLCEAIEGMQSAVSSKTIQKDVYHALLATGGEDANLTMLPSSISGLSQRLAFWEVGEGYQHTMTNLQMLASYLPQGRA